MCGFAATGFQGVRRVSPPETEMADMHETSENKGPKRLFWPSKMVAGVGFEPTTFRL